MGGVAESSEFCQLKAKLWLGDTKCGLGPVPATLDTLRC